MSVPVTKGVRIWQAVGVGVCALGVPIAMSYIEDISMVYNSTTMEMEPEVLYSFLSACVFTLPVLLWMWWIGYASKHRDDQARVWRTWCIMVGAIALFTAWTKSETHKQQQARGYR